MTNKVDEITTYDRVVKAQKTGDFLSPEWLAALDKLMGPEREAAGI
jgi:hypothetical protein